MADYNTQLLKEIIEDVSVNGLIIDNNGMIKLKELIVEHKKLTVEGISLERLIQFIYNEGSKASGLYILKEYRNKIK